MNAELQLRPRRPKSVIGKVSLGPAPAVSFWYFQVRSSPDLSGLCSRPWQLLVGCSGREWGRVVKVGLLFASCTRGASGKVLMLVLFLWHAFPLTVPYSILSERERREPEWIRRVDIRPSRLLLEQFEHAMIGMTGTKVPALAIYIYIYIMTEHSSAGCMLDSSALR